MADPIWVDNTTPVNSVNLTKLQTRDERGAPSGYAPLDATGRLVLGADAYLFRGGANILQSPGALFAAGQFAANYGIATQTAVGAYGPGGQSGVLFGSGGDTVLYRSGAGVLKSDGIINAVGGLQVNGVPVGGGDGWTPLSATITFSSQDGTTPTFFCTTSIDLTTQFGVGARLKLTHASAVKYFIVVAMTSSTLTLYGGTDYTLAATAITVPSFSREYAPVGFPMDATKWTQKFTNTIHNTQASPVQGTWYNPGSLSLVVPIGAWRIGYKADAGSAWTAAVSPQHQVTLSNNPSTESDPSLSGDSRVDVVNGTNVLLFACLGQTEMTLAAKTTYYLNIRSQSGSPASSISFYGTYTQILIYARSLYV